MDQAKTIFFIIVLLLFTYQNCSGVNFSNGDGFVSKIGVEDNSSENNPGDCKNCDDEDSEDYFQKECRKLDPPREEQTITVEGEVIVVSELIYKDNSGNEAIGFKLTSTTDDISYLVKASTEGFIGTGLSWINPYAEEGGPKAHAISHVTICVGIPPETIKDPSLRDRDIIGPGDGDNGGGEP